MQVYSESFLQTTFRILGQDLQFKFTIALRYPAYASSIYRRSASNKYRKTAAIDTLWIILPLVCVGSDGKVEGGILQER